MAQMGWEMQLEIDPRSAVPIYQQLRDRTVEAIARGWLVPGQQLASVRQVAVSFGINVATVSKAYDALRQDGFIHTNRKSGSIVARGPGHPVDRAFQAAWTDRLTTVLAEAVAQGMSASEIKRAVGGIIEGFDRSRGSAGSTRMKG